MDEPKYKRVLLKISGEALAGDKHFGLDFQVMGRVADVIKECVAMGVQVGVVIGGGNVSMDAVRTAKRMGAEKVSILYRRRRHDMTALPEEIEGAVAEGIELLTLKAPSSIDVDENGKITGLF